MNTLVLAIAGVFVFAGLALIVLSFLVGRTRPAADAVDAGLTSAETADEQGAFIDEPLVTDLATQLNGRRRPAESVESTATPTPIASSIEMPAATAAAGAAAIPTEVADQVGFDFRVQLGFKLLANGLHEDGVAEFNKALALTNDRETKLKLYVEIGNAFRAQQMPDPAGAAYLQATSYTDNPVLLEQLKRTIADMMESDDVGAADRAFGSERKE